MKMLIALVLSMPLCLAAAEGEPLAGHSYHGEVFNEGPRQAAWLMKGTGRINFPVTIANEQARAFFNQGVGQLHGFWYFEAERSFRQAALLDPSCAMNYWGMAMANDKNKKRAREFIAKAVERQDSCTARERMFISALDRFLKEDKRKEKEQKEAYAKDLEAIVEAHPDDIEAKAFCALQQWKNDSKMSADERTRVNAMLNEVLSAEPLHPVHHYRIHLWDNDGATNALNSAARGGAASPAIAHMWHMPGHTYSKLHRYSDAVWQQEASARTDHAYMIRNRVMPDQIHNFAHNNEWLIRNLNHLGAVDRAMALAKNMIELPRHPDYNTFKKGSANYGTLRLLETLVRYELWEEALRLSETQYLSATDNNDHEARRHHALGLARFWTGDLAGGERELAALEKLKSKRAKAKPATKSATKAPKGKAAPKKAASPKIEFLATLATIESAAAELRAVRAAVSGDAKAAKSELAKAKDQPSERLALIHAQLGQHDAALKAAEAGVKKNSHQIQPLANLARVALTAGKRDRAAKAFAELRPMAAEADLSAPVFKALAPLADATDWRPALKHPADFGERPKLDDLGPIHWNAPAAPDWTLPDGDNKSVGLKDYEGRAVIVIFYLGEGCAHCIEQLSAFAPLTDEFAGLGISLVGISTDTLPGLAKTKAKAVKDGGFPFPLVADPGLEVFKRYRAHDDFEKQPLHGTFLVSPQGRIVWQDISYEPFVKTDFLVAEARRLLGLKTGAKLATASGQ
jgi:peroxiredoxin